MRRRRKGEGMRFTHEDIESLITRIEYGDSDAMDEAEDLLNHATSDDWKDKFADELFSLNKAIALFNERARNA